ncbi:sulfite exporter TauE/SafE family protein [Mesorhizobium sp. BR1-1-16]|uniref:cytochrome c biogenesis CcdA family protein n=1 Tax=Mesorhizobium sp. BR1-1-16 TaxID=2876653 RepID=UPI001CCD25D9|nr:cytochrome c biogenesis protein CcdA [Mesorhizobium sp. BR1-1-16]MBZ9936323.1 sulfite exporter TauE/SafE family protein [Mesorhizobium sp. BR1-1-16]
MLSAVIFPFIAGLLTILNPCVLPLAPIIVAGARARDPLAPLALAAGLAITFGLFGGLLASLGAELGDTGAGRIVLGAAMLVFGVVMLVPALAHRAEMAMAPLGAWADRQSGRMPAAGLAAQAGIGAILAIAWAPCVGPTLGAALTLAAAGGSLAAAMGTMVVFALGAATSLLVAGYGLGKLARRGRSAAGRSASIGRALLGLAFALVGFGMVTGLDKVVEGALVEAMPDWLVTFATRF